MAITATCRLVLCLTKADSGDNSATVVVLHPGVGDMTMTKAMTSVMRGKELE